MAHWWFICSANARPPRNVARKNLPLHHPFYRYTMENMNRTGWVHELRCHTAPSDTCIYHIHEAVFILWNCSTLLLIWSSLLAACLAHYSMKLSPMNSHSFFIRFFKIGCTHPGPWAGFVVFPPAEFTFHKNCTSALLKLFSFHMTVWGVFQYIWLNVLCVFLYVCVYTAWLVVRRTNCFSSFSSFFATLQPSDLRKHRRKVN